MSLSILKSDLKYKPVSNIGFGRIVKTPSDIILALNKSSSDIVSRLPAQLNNNARLNCEGLVLDGLNTTDLVFNLNSQQQYNGPRTIIIDFKAQLTNNDSDTSFQLFDNGQMDCTLTSAGILDFDISTSSIYGGTNTSGSYTYVAGKRIVAVFVWDGVGNRTPSIFVDGKKVSSGGTSGSGTENSPNSFFRIGSNYGNNYFSNLNGTVYSFFNLKGRITESYAANLSKNPYQYLPAKRRYLFQSSSSTTPVFNDSDLRWQLLNEISQDSDIRWQILNQVLSDSDIRWQILNAVLSDSDIRWQILSEVLQDSDLRWQLLNEVTSDSDLRWQLLNEVLNDSDLRWQILTQVLNDSDIRWQILEEVFQDSDIRWQIQSSLTSVSNDMDIRWQLLASVFNDFDIRWQILAVVNNDLDARWQILNEVGINSDLRWQILNAVNNQIDARWQILEGIVSDVEFQWSMEGKVNSEISLRWRIVGTEIVLPMEVIVIPAENRVIFVSDESRIIEIE